MISEVITSFRELKSRYENLWLGENHTYALDRMQNKFDRKINDYIDVKERLFSSLKKLDSREQIPSIADVRLAVYKIPGKYFREWMMINPLPDKDMLANSQVDYLTEMGGEANAEPKVAQEFYFDSLKYRWRRVVSGYQDIVNLSEIFPETQNNSVTYAFANITVDNDTTVDALTGCVKGIQVFINGTKVFTAENKSDKITPDEFAFKLPLKAGKNNLLIKITQTKGNWEFTFRLPGSEVRNSKNRYRIVQTNK